MPKTVLLIDDFLISNEIVSRELISAGYEVVCLQKPERAIEILQNKHFDLVITDYVMPKMNGIDLLCLIRKLHGYENTPVIIMSGNKNAEIKQKAIDEKVSAWIDKPFTKDKLFKVIETLL